jgi:hypothetical protein
MRRPDGVTLISVYHFLRAALMLLAMLALIALPFAVGVFAEGDRDAMLWTSMASAVSLLFVGLVFLVNLVVGLGLLRMREWSRIAAIVLAVPRLFSFPVGTLIGGLTIWYLLQEPVSAEFGR